MQDEEVLGKAYDSRLMRRLIAYLRPYRKHVLFALRPARSRCGIRNDSPLLTMIAIDRYIAAGDSGGLAIVAGAYVLALAVKFGTEFVQALTLQRTGQKIMFDMRMQIFSASADAVAVLLRPESGRTPDHAGGYGRRCSERTVFVRHRFDLRRHLYAAGHHHRDADSELENGAGDADGDSVHRRRNGQSSARRPGTPIAGCASPSRRSMHS